MSSLTKIIPRTSALSRHFHVHTATCLSESIFARIGMKQGHVNSVSSADAPHFRKNTNNRIESNFGKLKLDLDSGSTMKERQESLMRHQRRSENESLARVSYEGQWVHYDYDQELGLVLHICTPWVASTMKRECDFAISDEAARIYTFKEKRLGTR
ncbi:hypothetical protein GQ600_23736 [Phytophthora cactorum]|nr:hypothetical protein GQ600_23736 [Phytophthora cactorum]